MGNLGKTFIGAIGGHYVYVNYVSKYFAPGIVNTLADAACTTIGVFLSHRYL